MFIFPRRISYFSQDLKPELKGLYWTMGLFGLAINLTYIFEPIFLYNLGYSLTEIMLFYAIVYSAYSLLVVPITKVTSLIGYKHAILLSAITYVIYWIVLYQIKFNPDLFFIAPVLFAAQKCFFWPPYNADVALNNAKQQRGREVGALFSVFEVAAITGPIIGGFLSHQFGFPVLFSVAAMLMLASVYPLFLTPEVYTKHRFHFKNLWSVIRHYPRNFFGYWGYAEDLMLMSLWPIFMYLIIPEVFSLGALITVASIIAIVVMLYLGKLIDSKKLPLLKIIAVFYGFTWLFRGFIGGLGSLLAFDALTRLGKAAVNVPIHAITYEISGKRGPDFAIAYSVFFEFSLSIAKVLTALAAIWILSSGGEIYHVFILSGVLTMFYALLRK